MRKIINAIAVFLFFSPAFGQVADSLSLFDCYRLARENAPKLSMLDLYQEKANLESKIISSHNLPQFTAFGNAWYQSDAMGMYFPEPIGLGMEIDQFQYNTVLNVDQVLYDGGVSKVQKELARIRAEASGFETEASLNQLNILVNTYFFGILGIKSTKEALMLKINQLKERKEQLISAVNNGLALESDLERLNAEILLTDQEMNDLSLSGSKFEQALKKLIGAEQETVIFPLEPQSIMVADSIIRPELDVFRSNKAYLDKTMDIQSRKYLPKLLAYGRLGYSYPGLNFFENQPAGYYMAGFKISWNIFDWKTAGTENQLLALNKEQINIQEKEFVRNLNIEIQNVKLEIQNLDKQIDIDKKIIEAYESATQSSVSALDNGSITSVEYLADLNAELRARIKNKIHVIQRLEAQARLYILTGQVSN